MHFLTRNIRVCASRCVDLGGSLERKICDILTTPLELLRPWAALCVCMCACVHVCWLLSFGIWIVTSGSWLRTHPSNAARLLHGSTYNTPLPITTAHPVILHANAIIFIVCTPVCVSLSAAVHVLVYLWNSAHNHSDKTNTRPEANLHFFLPQTTHMHTKTHMHLPNESLTMRFSTPVYLCVVGVV